MPWKKFNHRKRKATKKKAKKRKAKRDPIRCPRNSHRWTEARFWQFIRSALRAASARWQPASDALEAVKRHSQSKTNKRLKWEYQCAGCEGWFARKQVELDHIVEVGELREADDLPGFVTRLFCEQDGYQVLCEQCHKDKTHA